MNMKKNKISEEQIRCVRYGKCDKNLCRRMTHYLAMMRLYEGRIT